MSHSSSVLPPGQEWFMLLMKNCLYDDVKSFSGEGRCTGITHTLSRLFLTHKDEAVYPLLQYIYTNVTADTASELRKRNKKSLPKSATKGMIESHPDAEQMKTEALTFFALTESTQIDDFHFDSEIKEIIKTSKLFSPVDYKKIGGIRPIPSSCFTWSYTVETLTEYFNSLKKVLGRVLILR